MTPRGVVGFCVLVVAALAGVAVAPAPYAEDVAVERATGAPAPTPAHTLATSRGSGSLDVVAGRLETLPRSSLVQAVAALAAQEYAAPEFPAMAAGTATAPVERWFEGVDARAGLDARAAMLQRRLLAGDRPALSELLALAERFHACGRERAELRWLQRAVEHYPDAALPADRLLALYVAHRELEPALALVEKQERQRATDAGWQRQLATLGAWLGRADVEIRALERLCAATPDTSDRRRLIDLYAYIGQPDRALPHAIALVDGAAEVAAAEAAASAVLRAGMVDEGLSMLERAASRAEAPASWWQRYATLLRQDLRVGDSAAALARAGVADGGESERALEELYRRTDQPELLADLLQRRLARTPGDAAAWREVVTLRYALGQREAAQALARQREVALADPARFVATLPPDQRESAAALRERALSLSLTASAESGVVGETLEQLRPFLAQPGFRVLAESLLARHPNDPRAKGMRTELVDIGRSPAEAESAAAALAAAYADDVALARLWLQRAQWAENVEAQIAARKHLEHLAPEDRDNRHDLGDLLEFAGRNADAIAQWRTLAQLDGLSSPAVPRLIAALQAAGDADEALEWLRRLASDARATDEQRLAAAEELFDRRRFPDARVLYEAVLAGTAEQPLALLRLGQLAAQRGDFAAAVGLFERRLAATADDAALVGFALGEAEWALGRHDAARARHAATLAAIAAAVPTDPDDELRTAMAVMLDRVGRPAEAAAAYRVLLERNPRNADLVLDYADLALRRGELAAADGAARYAETLAPDSARAARLRGELARVRGDLAAAETAVEQALARGDHGVDVFADLTTLRRERGDWRGASGAAARWREAAPDDPAAERAQWQLDELLADFAAADVRWRSIGDERSLRAGVGGVHLFDDRHWLQASLAGVDLRGPTSASASGEASATFAELEATFGWRVDADDRIAVGIAAAPGAEGDAPIGAHASAHWQWRGAALQLQTRLHELWSEPAAAAALGGRVSSADVLSYVDLGERTWLAANAGIARFGLDDRLGGGRADARAHVDATAGWRWLPGEHAVATWFAPTLVPAGPESPFLTRVRDDGPRWAGEASLHWRMARVLGDSELASVLPFAVRDDQLTGVVRVDRHVAAKFGAAISGYAGIDLRDGEPIFGAAAAMTWRPSFGTEFTLEGSRGAAFGRGGDDPVEELRLQVVLRW